MAARKPKETAEKKKVSEREPLKNKLVITTREPTKISRKLCKILRKVFDPESMSGLREINPRLKDCISVADSLRVSHFVLVSEKVIKIGQRPKGPTYTFEITEFDGSFQYSAPEIFSKPAFVTFEGKSDLKTLFEKFGGVERGFQRVLHFCFLDDKIYVRHYRTAIKDTDDNFVVGLKELGPRITLRLIKQSSGFFPDK